jgi:hypothetical protein
MPSGALLGGLLGGLALGFGFLDHFNLDLRLRLWNPGRWVSANERHQAWLV